MKRTAQAPLKLSTSLLRFAVPLGWLLASSPVAAQTVTTVLEDHDLTSWQFVTPPEDPDVSLVHFDYGNPYLIVRQAHRGTGYSRKITNQGSFEAVYDPQTLGALGALEISARLRPHFDGLPAAQYASRVIQARPFVRQNGVIYLADTDLFEWSTTLPLELWSEHALTELSADRFRTTGSSPTSPDFDGGAPPLSFGLQVTTSFQSGSEAPFHTFELDVDDFVVRARPAEDDALRLRFEAPYGIGVVNGVGVAVLQERFPYYQEGRRIRLALRLSRPEHDAVEFEVLHHQSQTRVRGRIPEGVSSVEVVVPLGLREATYEISRSQGADLGSPARAIFIASYREDTEDCIARFLRDPWLVLASLRAPAPGPRPRRLEAGEALGFLPTLEAFRDQVMANTPVGRRYIALYRTWSNELVLSFLSRPLLLFDLYESSGAWLEGLAALVDGRGEASVVTADMAADLDRILDGFAAGAGPALARAIAEERQRLGLDSVAGLTMEAFWERVLERGDGVACTPSTTTLCLDGGRHRVEADYRTFTGAAGRARGVPLSANSGYFWFFDAANVEILSKVIDGCGTNGSFWSYNAGLTNLDVQLSVLDVATGNGHVYRREPAAAFAPILDSSYAPCAGESGAFASSPALSVTAAPAGVGAGTCTPSDAALCLLGGRFRATATWRTAAGATGVAHAAPLTADTGTFWFFSPGNVELVVKAIDACGLPDFHNRWIFAAGTTDVAVDLHVEDTVTGAFRDYRRPLGVPFEPVLDSHAFGGCP